MAGHHSASFTLDTYIHLLREDEPEPPAFFDELLGDRFASLPTDGPGRLS